MKSPSQNVASKVATVGEEKAGRCQSAQPPCKECGRCSLPVWAEGLIINHRLVSVKIWLQSAPVFSLGSDTLISSSILQVANSRIQSLEATVEKLLTRESKLKQATLALELERSALLQMVEELQRPPAGRRAPSLSPQAADSTGDSPTPEKGSGGGGATPS